MGAPKKPALYDGESVARISKGLYRIVQGGIELISNDMAAP